jgi:hypothetical protein
MRTLSSATDLEVADRLMSLLLDVEDLSGLPCEWAQDDAQEARRMFDRHSR